MKKAQIVFLLFVLAVSACSVQSQNKYEGDTIESFVDKNVMFEVTYKEHKTYYDLMSSIEMLADRRGIKSSPQENPVIIDSCLVSFRSSIDEKRASGTILIQANVSRDFYYTLDAGSFIDGESLLKAMGENYTARIDIWTAKKDIEKLTLEDLEKEGMITVIEKTIRGAGYSPLPEDDVCIDPMDLALRLYNFNMGWGSFNSISSFKYVVIDETILDALIGTWVWEFEDEESGISEMSSLTITADAEFQLEDAWTGGLNWNSTTYIGTVAIGTIGMGSGASISLDPTELYQYPAITEDGITLHGETDERFLSPVEQANYRQTFIYNIPDGIMTRDGKVYTRE